VIAALGVLVLASGGQPAQAAQQAAGTPTATPRAAGPAATAVSSATGTVTTTQAAGTPKVRPTPGGAPPDPEEVLTFFGSPSGAVLVKRDYLQLDKDSQNEILFTLTGPSDVVTGENHTDIGVLDYDPKYREWNLGWNTSDQTVLGLGSPLPAANRGDGYNGGNLLGTGSPIFLMRTTTVDGRAHLRMWKWDTNKQLADPVKMQPAGGGAEREEFDADLDLSVADLDNDGKYEVVADNLSGTQIWKWDGSKYVPEVQR